MKIVYNNPMNDMLGVELKNIKRVLCKPGEMGYEIGLHHHYIALSGEAVTYDPKQPMGIVNIPSDEKSMFVVFVDWRWRDNIETVSEPPKGYELCALTYFDSGPIDIPSGVVQ